MTSMQTFQIKQVDLTITNLERSVDFYQKIVGLHLIEKSEKEAVLGTPDGSALVQLFEDKEAKQVSKRSTGLYHFAILLPTRKDLASFLKHLVETRYPVVGASDHLFSEAIYFQDPDDIGIEVYADRAREDWKYVDGRIQAATNPLDVEDLMKEYQHTWEGVPANTIIGHLHFHVSDIPAARAFYVDQFGMDPMIEYGDQVLFVSGEGYHHHIGLNIWQGRGAKIPDAPTVGLKKAHIVISESDRQSLLESGMLNGETGEFTDPFAITYQVNQ